jgi:hypothetical protein
LAPLYPEELSSQNRCLFQDIKDGHSNFVCNYWPVFFSFHIMVFPIEYIMIVCTVLFSLSLILLSMVSENTLLLMVTSLNALWSLCVLKVRLIMYILI